MKTDISLSIKELIKAVRADMALLEVKRAKRHGDCKHCGCYLSLKREESTGFHIKRANGLIEYIVVYTGKSYCQACHRFQVQDAANHG